MAILISPLPHRVSLVVSSECLYRRMLYLHQRHVVVDCVMLCRIDVKKAFRQIPADPLHAAKFGYVFGEFAVVALFLKFVWRNSSGCWDVVASSLENAYNQTSFPRDGGV